MINKTKPPPGWGVPRQNAHRMATPSTPGGLRVVCCHRPSAYVAVPYSEDWEAACLAEAHRIAEENAAPYVAEAVAKREAQIVAWLRRRAASYRGVLLAATPESVTLDAAADAINRGEVK